MSGRTLRSLFNRLKGYDEIDDSFSLVWHAGEPLAAGLEFYRNAAQHIDAFHVEKDVRIREFIQTNGTLITAAWCDWFAERDIRIGLSIDGPDHVHDQNRIDRRGGGTHKKCMDGLRLLSEYGISFYNIAVISDYSLDYPDDIFDFFVDNGIFDFGVNFAEIEGVNIASAVLKKEFEGRAEEFLRRFIERVETGPRHVRMRELDGFKSYLSHGPRRGLSQNCKPGAIISVSRVTIYMRDPAARFTAPERFRVRCSDSSRSRRTQTGSHHHRRPGRRIGGSASGSKSLRAAAWAGRTSSRPL